MSRASGPETVFISYAREDAHFVKRLVGDLRGNGIDVWIDSDIEVGAPWDLEIERTIRAAGRMVVVLSPRSVSSSEVTNEWSFALEDKDLVVPVLLEECEVPFRLRRLQRVNFSERYEDGLSELLDRLGPNRSSTMLPVATTDEPPPGQRRTRFALGALALATVFVAWRLVVIPNTDRGRSTQQAAAVTLPSSEAHPKEPPVQVQDASLGEKLVREYRDLKDSRSRLLLAKDRWLSAAESFEGALQQPTLPAATRSRYVSAAHFCRGSEQLLNGTLEDAEEQWRAAVAADDGWAPPYVELASLMARLGRYREGHDMARAAQRVEPEFWLARAASAPVFASEGKMHDAISVYEVLVANSDEDLPLVKGNLALAYHAARQHDARALRLAEEALLRDPNLAPALTVLAERALEAGQLEKARDYSQRLVDTMVFDVSAWLVHGDILLASGDKALARAAYERALSESARTRQIGAPVERLAVVRKAIEAGELPPLRPAPAASAPGYKGTESYPAAPKAPVHAGRSFPKGMPELGF